MSWTFYLVGERICGGCGGTCGWNVKGKFHRCTTCDGTGVEMVEMDLEEALAQSETIKDIRDAVDELINHL